ncbi:hypothetical protein DUNSADRAFT_18005 [Dunaliella salina]|uniref:Encoded protein n=1 Tax=Dunaliella salina TaxID=3046 RepID=A0ABQ7G0U8_DUNSA|nr:hypothetical protein DUNSADRAFT_18005 [Dunaliella salina]|eukprot:KAF5828224.1 hypothetical protein DUNSADRAFT_18005 [Dunaliella salina]
MVHHANFGTASSSLTRFFKGKQGFQAPAGYGGKAAAEGTRNAGQGAAGGSAFQVVASNAVGSAQGSGTLPLASSWPALLNTAKRAHNFKLWLTAGGPAMI